MAERLRRWSVEMGIGLAIAVLLILVAATTVTTVHFVYQGF
jgi:hypothetical protein